MVKERPSAFFMLCILNAQPVNDHSFSCHCQEAFKNPETHGINYDGSVRSAGGALMELPRHRCMLPAKNEFDRSLTTYDDALLRS
jgi:hypothetical protein